MIDIENKVIDTIQNAFTSASKAVNVYSADVPSEVVYPCAVVMEIDNTDYTKTGDDALNPHAARVTYQVETYSNLIGGAKADSKALFAIADTAMHNMKFTRTSYDYFPEDSLGVVRYVGRYSAVVWEGKTSGTTTTYQIYRN